MEQNAPSRMAELDLWKFIFCFVIFLLHCVDLPFKAPYTLMQGGSIAVDFYFLVNGFLLARSVSRKGEVISLASETGSFIRKKIFTFLPYYLYAVITSFTVYSVFHSGSLIDRINDLGRELTELLLIRQAGFNKASFTGTSWYLSAMLLSMLILYPMLRRFGVFFRRIGCLIIALFSLGYLFLRFGHLRGPLGSGYFLMKGTIRAFGEIALGIVCFELCCFISRYRFTLFTRIILTLIEYGGLIFVILYTNVTKYAALDAECVIIMACAVIIAGCNLSVLSESLGRLSIMPKLGKFSMIFFMNHCCLFPLFNYFRPDMSDTAMLLLYFGCAVADTLLCWFLIDLIKKLYSGHKDRIRRIFIS